MAPSQPDVTALFPDLKFPSPASTIAFFDELKREHNLNPVMNIVDYIESPDETPVLSAGTLERCRKAVTLHDALEAFSSMVKMANLVTHRLLGRRGPIVLPTDAPPWNGDPLRIFVLADADFRCTVRQLVLVHELQFSLPPCTQLLDSIERNHADLLGQCPFPVR